MKKLLIVFFALILILGGLQFKTAKADPILEGDSGTEKFLDAFMWDYELYKLKVAGIALSALKPDVHLGNTTITIRGCKDTLVNIYTTFFAGSPAKKNIEIRSDPDPLYGTLHVSETLPSPIVPPEHLLTLIAENNGRIIKMWSYVAPTPIKCDDNTRYIIPVVPFDSIFDDSDTPGYDEQKYVETWGAYLDEIGKLYEEFYPEQEVGEQAQMPEINTEKLANALMHNPIFLLFCFCCFVLVLAFFSRVLKRA